MWWDSAQISVLESVFFSFAIIVILYLVGFSFVKIFSFFGKLSDPFSSLGFFQKLTFRILFGFIFVVLLVVLLSFFGLSFLVSSLVIISIVGLGLVVAGNSARPFKLRLHSRVHFRKYSLLIIVFVLLSLTIFLSSMVISDSFGSTNDDGADHTLMTRIVLDNPNVLVTRSGQPYANFLIRYPLGTHILSAFVVTSLDVAIQKIIILMTAVFPALIALSFYSTLKCLFNSKVLSILGLIVAGFFTIGLFMSPISWGGLPLLLSFYFSISAMGLIFLFSFKKKATWLTAFLLGLIFFVASRTYPVALLMISFWFLLVLGFKLFSHIKAANWSFSFSSIIQRKNAFLFVAFLLPILLAFPYFYAILTNNFSAVQNSLINIVSGWSGVVKNSISFNWVFDFPALWAFFSGFGRVLALASLSLILLIGLFIPKLSSKIDYLFPLKVYRTSILLVYSFMLLILGYLTFTLYLPVDFMTTFFDPSRVLQFISVPAIILTSIVIFFGFCVFGSVFKRLFFVKSKKDLPALGKLRRYRVLAIGLVALLVCSIVVLIVPVLTEEQGVYYQARNLCFAYQTLGKADVSLMEWIHVNVPINASILVSSGDSGQYLASVTQRQTISLNSRLANYSYLMSVLSNNSSDLRAIPFLVEYNISYVYIGSIHTEYGLQYPYYRTLNTTQFLSTPYFILTKEVGNAWLFKFNATEALGTSALS
jgi:hypothetical protein